FKEFVIFMEKEIIFVGSKGIPNNYGGLEQMTEAISLRLIKRGYKVRVHSTTIHEKRKYWKNIELIKVRQFGNPYFERILREIIPLIYEIKQRIKEGKNNKIIHATGAFLFLFLWKLFGFKIIYSTDGLEWRRKSYNLIGKILVYLGYLIGSKTADIVTFDTKIIKDYYNKNWNVDGPLIYYGPKSLREEYKSDILRKNNLSEKNYFIFVGRLVPEKGIDTLIKAYNKSSLKYPLVIIGKDPFDGTYESYLKNISGPKIQFLGTIFSEDFSYLLKNALIHLRGIKDISEGMNPVLIESLSFGVGIIATNVEQNIEACGNSALYFKPDDEKTLFKILKDLDDEKIKTLCKKALKRGKKLFSWEKSVDKFEKYYQYLI
ncbi:hypothetical protein LCGC14_1531030, partial [marine sediment metagenome]